MTFKGIDLTPLNLLDSHIPSLFSHFYKDPHHFEVAWLDPYSLFLIDRDLDPKNIDLKGLYRKYPALEFLVEDLDSMYPEEYVSSIYYVANKKYLKEDLNKLIAKHNSTLDIPAKDELLKEKDFIIDWRNYNTPTAKDISITPLHGMSLPDMDLEDKSPLNIYNQWKISSYMLIWEYNILKKAKRYLDNKDSNLASEDSCEKAYNYWKNRQIEMQMGSSAVLVENSYSLNFFEDGDAIKREIFEDLLYVLLNIVLAKSIVDSININSYINNEAEFYSKLESNLKVHYENNKEGYKCLNKLRVYFSNNYLTRIQLKGHYTQNKS